MKIMRGFTLIELLVTISIIAILSAIGLIAYANVSKQGRDSKRQSDLRTIQSALEQYFADQLYYPVLSTSTACPPTNGEFKIGCALKDPNRADSSYVNRIYINNIPKDPKSPEYCYKPLKSGEACTITTPSCNSTSDKCVSYCLYANLEGQSAGSDSCSSNTYNYKLTPP